MQTASSTVPTPHPADDQDALRERFDVLVNAPALFNAVTSAAELGLFSFLAEHQGATTEQIRAAVGLPAHALRVLLQAVCATGLVLRRDGGYHNSGLAAERLAPDAPDSWRHILVGWRDIYYPAFTQTTGALRAGRNTALDGYPGDEPTLYGRLSHRPAAQDVFHRAMSAFTLQTLPALAERPEFAAVRHLLDVGGGGGTTAAALVARHPGLRVTIFDVPSVTELAGDAISAEHVQGVRLHPGDLFRDPFPDGTDAVLFSHLLEIFAPERIRELMAKAYDALPSGGRVFCYGFNVSDDETEGLYSARLSLYLNVLASGQGMAYPAGDYEDWMREAGFRHVSTVRGLPYEHGLTCGTKG